MHFIDILAKILNNEKTGIRFPKRADPDGLELGDVVSRRLPIGAKRMIFDLQGLIYLLKKQETADLRQLAARFPAWASRRKTFRSRKEFYEKSGKATFIATGIHTDANHKIGVIDSLIAEIVRKHFPQEEEYRETAYFLTKQGKLLRGVGI